MRSSSVAQEKRRRRSRPLSGRVAGPSELSSLQAEVSSLDWAHHTLSDNDSRLRRRVCRQGSNLTSLSLADEDWGLRRHFRVPRYSYCKGHLQSADSNMYRQPCRALGCTQVAVI